MYRTLLNVLISVVSGRVVGGSAGSRQMMSKGTVVRGTNTGRRDLDGF